MKLALEMSSVEATSPPTLTCAFLPNRTPAELTMKTCPLALSAPEMTLVSLPITRLRVTDELPGWLKLTVSFAPIENPCQLMMVLLVDGLMLVTLPDWEMPAEPSTTEPPTGPASAVRCAINNAATAVMVAKRTGDEQPRAVHMM